MLNENGFFFFRFNDEGGCNQVIEAGPLMVRGVPLFVFPWVGTLPRVCTNRNTHLALCGLSCTTFLLSLLTGREGGRE